MNEGPSLYDQDFVRWSEEQSAAIRAAAQSGANLPLDWENIAEEIESLGRSDKRELRNRTRTLIAHLLKLQCSPAAAPKEGWATTVRRTRQEIEELIAESPSLRPERERILRDVLASETDLTARELDTAGEADAAATARNQGRGYDVEHVFGDWMPVGTAASP